MKLTIQPIFIALCCFSMLSCSQVSTETENNDAPTSKEAKPETIEQKSVSEVVDGYLLLKDALVASDANLTKEKAIKMLETIDATLMPEVQQFTKTIAASDDLDEQRVYFDSLSINLYQNLQQSKANQQPLYKQFCPMAFNHRGAYWLSNTEEIRNPYFGNDMLTCGKTEEVLEPGEK